MHVIELTPSADGKARRLPLTHGWAVFTGECVATLAPVMPATFDSVVSDPPYHLTGASRNGSPRINDPSTPFGRTALGSDSGGFMGQSWDGGAVAFDPATWTAILRVAKPGAYLVAHGGPRTWHRLACGIEDAGWTVHDSIAFGHDVETIARGLWDTLDAVQREHFAAVWDAMCQRGGPLAWLFGTGFPKHRSKLKPGWEPIVLARKPGALASETPLQIDACRIEHDGTGIWGNHGQNPANHVAVPGSHGVTLNGSWHRPGSTRHDGGRWPANVVLDESAARDLDAIAGDKGGGGPGGLVTFSQPNIRGDNYNRAPDRQANIGMSYADAGGPSRFYYTAKASRSERNDGLDTDAGDGLAERNGGANARGFTDDVARGNDRNRPTKNHHPTVKPLSLTQWLARLITPPAGLVLDPMAGSGTTGVACQREGFGCVMLEQHAEYADIARARNRAAQARIVAGQTAIAKP